MSYQPPPPPPGNYPPPPPGGGNYPPPGPPPGGGNYPPPGGGNYPPQGPPPGGGYQQSPPQGGGYPPAQQQGGYPQQQPGYGQPPPGYPAQPPGGYQQGYGGPPTVDVGAAFSWAWNKFSKNAGPIIIATLIYGAVLGVLGAIFYGILIFAILGSVGSVASLPTTTDAYGNTIVDPQAAADAGGLLGGIGIGAFLFIIIAALVMVVVGGAISSAYLGGLLDIANGTPVEVGSFLKPRSIGSVILASLIIGVVSGISILVIVGPLVVAIFTIFTSVSIVERNLSPIDGIKNSFELVKANFVPVLLTYLLIYVITAVGGALCGIGLLVAWPVAQLLLIYTYRKLSGGQLAPLTP
jgi:uncharacterized membrane protein